MATRPLWHDELYTYYIAKSPTLSSFIAAVTHLDLQPPLGYVLSRISMKAFGDSAFVTRLPSMIAFAVASLCLYYVVRRRLGRFYGLVAMLVLWLSPFFFFAAKARPYALVLGFLRLANPLAYGRGRSDRPRLQISSLTVFWRDRGFERYRNLSSAVSSGGNRKKVNLSVTSCKSQNSNRRLVGKS